MTAACHRSSVRTPDPGLPSESGEWNAILDMATHETVTYREIDITPEEPHPCDISRLTTQRQHGRIRISA